MRDSKQRQTYDFEKLFVQNLRSIEQIMLLNNVNPGELESLNETVPIALASIQNIMIESFKVEWIFGQSFDDYQDKFVTLNDRNETKLILEKFDMEATDLPNL